jgi:hypothetical protein
MAAMRLPLLRRVYLAQRKTHLGGQRGQRCAQLVRGIVDKTLACLGLVTIAFNMKINSINQWLNIGGYARGINRP